MTSRRANPTPVLMNAADDGDKHVVDQPLLLVYELVRKAVRLSLAAERADHTRSATARVHEAYLKLVGPLELTSQGPAHSYSAAAWPGCDLMNADCNQDQRGNFFDIHPFLEGLCATCP